MDRKSFHYPKRCDDCRRKPATKEITKQRIERINLARIVHPVGTTRLHKTRNNVYRLIKVDTFSKRWLYEHRVVAESMVGRKLIRGEVVHHINENTLDNRKENLQVMLAGDHVSLHGKIETWSKKHSQCVGCKSSDRKHLALGYCTRCYQRLDRHICS